ncbi:MAG: hypothetical protein AAF961_00565, partial [Planctomycetota bacterium]
MLRTLAMPPDQMPPMDPARVIQDKPHWSAAGRRNVHVGFLAILAATCIWAALVAEIACSQSLGPPQPATPAPHPSPVRPRILVLRGLLEVFSLGMNDLAEKLSAFGYDATSTSWTLALSEVDCSDERPLIVVGHSLGGRACNWVSRKLGAAGKRVPLIIIVDANLIQAIPSNVDRCVHLY